MMPPMTTTMSRVMARLLEGELGAALVQHAEQQRGEDDPGRMGAAHEGDRDADEAVAGAELEDEPVLVAHELVDREAAGERRRRGPWQ